MKSIGVIIANYNTSELLIECVQNLLNIKEKISDKYDLKITVIDNGSSDDSVSAATEEFGTNITLIATQNNGLSKAYNMGLGAFSCDFYLFLGSDAFPTTEALLEVLKFAEDNKEAGLITPRLVLRDGSPDMDAHRGFPTPWASFTHFSFINKVFKKSRLFNQYFIGYEDLRTRHEIDLCISHFMLIKSEVFTKIGTWDEDFFVFGEDVDMCYRVKKGGYKIFYLGDIEVLHYKGASVGRATAKNITKADQSTKLRMADASVNAMRMFYTKHYANKYPKILTNLILFAISYKGILRRLLVKFK